MLPTPDQTLQCVTEPFRVMLGPGIFTTVLDVSRCPRCQTPTRATRCCSDLGQRCPVRWSRLAYELASPESQCCIPLARFGLGCLDQRLYMIWHRTIGQENPAAPLDLSSVRASSVIHQCIELIVQSRQGDQPTIVVSGPPCQGFSIAGPRDPNDPRNQILLAVARSIVALKPRCAVIETVARVLDDNHSDRLEKLARVLTSGGFHVNEVVLNAEDYGVPQ